MVYHHAEPCGVYPPPPWCNFTTRGRAGMRSRASTRRAQAFKIAYPWHRHHASPALAQLSKVLRLIPMMMMIDFSAVNQPTAQTGETHSCADDTTWINYLTTGEAVYVAHATTVMSGHTPRSSRSPWARKDPYARASPPPLAVASPAAAPHPGRCDGLRACS